MRTLLMTIALLASTTVMAGEFTVYGKIHFQAASTWVSAKNVCQNAGTLYHKTKDYVKVTCHPKDGCSDYVKPLVQPMKANKKVCLKATGKSGDNCVEYGVTGYNQGTVKIESYKSEKDWDLGKAPTKVTSYTVDSCGSMN